MFRRLLPVAFAIALSSCATTPPNPGDQIPVIACIGTEGRWLRGNIDPTRYSGSFSAQTNDNVSCVATWQTGRINPEFGTGTLTCEDGLTADIDYLNISRLGGTSIGSGITNAGQQISVWSGGRVPAAIAATNDFSVAPLCNGTPTQSQDTEGNLNQPSTTP